MLQSFLIFSKQFCRQSVKIAHKRYFHHTSQHYYPIKSVHIDNEKEIVQVAFTNDVQESFPWHFLQDNCTCEECFHSASQSRKKRMTTLDLTKKVLKADLVSSDNSNSSVKLTWSDGHEGNFSKSWLLSRTFSKDNQERRKLGFRDRIQLVGSDYKIKRFSFQKVLADDETLLEFLLHYLCKSGIALLTDAPKEVGQLQKLADKIGFIRITHYGKEFTVRSIPNAVNLAYTSTPLTVHTDLPYYVNPPGVQLLHCIKQFYGEENASLGGESHLVDGFIVAELMKENFRDEYAALCNTAVEFYDIGQDYIKFHKIHHSPTFVECPTTVVNTAVNETPLLTPTPLTRIVYSNQQLSSYLPIDLDVVQPLYKALKIFTSLCYDEKFLMKFKLQEGEILVFDNWRFLHGRSGFDPNKGERHLEGCYIDWDEIFSRIRVIQSNGQ